MPSPSHVSGGLPRRERGIILNVKKLPYAISTCLAAGGLVMALFMCLYVDFGIHSTVGKIALYIAFLLQGINILMARLRIRSLVRGGTPAPSRGMRRFLGVFLWIWRLGALLLGASLVLILFGMDAADPWVRYTCISGVCVTPVGWLGVLAACRRRAQAATVSHTGA